MTLAAADVPTSANRSASQTGVRVAKPGRRPWLYAALGLLATGSSATAMAQGPTGAGNTVSWTASVQGSETVKAGSRVSVMLSGAVVDGWHVYAIEQPARGPIPMSVWLEANSVAVADGKPTASAPEKVFDRSFGFETRYYSAPFKLTVPVRVNENAAPGRQEIPVTVQFQTCNGINCQPPKNVKLNAVVTVRAR